MHYCDHALSVVRPSLTFHIFDFSSETTEQNDRKLDLNVLYQVCVLREDRKNKMAALASDWLRHFRLLLLNCWTVFNENLTGSKISTSSTKFVFFGQSEKQDGHTGLWLAEKFSTSPLKPLNRIKRNLTGSNISMSSSKLVYFGWSEKQDGCPGLSLAETFSTSPLKPLNRIQRNLTGSKISMSSTKFVFFGADRKDKMATLASDWLRHFLLLLWNH